MEHDIVIQNEGIILDALDELNSSYQNLCTIYSEIESILSKLEAGNWDTSDIGTDADIYKTNLRKNINLMKGDVLPNFKQFNQLIMNLMSQYSAQQQ